MIEGRERGRRVLIGFADALAAIESAWSLLDSGFSVCAFSRRGSAPPLRRVSRLEVSPITAPEEDVDRSLDDLRALCRAWDVEALMPLDDASLWLSRRVGNGVGPVFVGPGRSQTGVALDKRLQRAAAEAGRLFDPTDPADRGRNPARGRPRPSISGRRQTGTGRIGTRGASDSCGRGDYLRGRGGTETSDRAGAAGICTDRSTAPGGHRGGRIRSGNQRGHSGLERTSTDSDDESGRFGIERLHVDTAAGLDSRDG